MQILKPKLIFAAIVMICVSLLSGCFVAPYTYTCGQSIKEDKLKKIEAGKTTKEEIIKWFGVPSTVVNKGEKAGVTATQYGAAGLIQSTGFSFDELFSLFSSRHKSKESHVIYYYDYTKTEGATFNIIFFSPSNSKVLTDKLLVLIDENTCIVEDYIFSKQR